MTFKVSSFSLRNGALNQSEDKWLDVTVMYSTGQQSQSFIKHQADFHEHFLGALKTQSSAYRPKK